MRKPESLAYRFADILNGHDASRFSDLVAEDYVNHNSDAPPGRDGLIGFVQHWFDTLVDTRVTVEDVLASGRSVVGRDTDRGRHVGPFMGVPPSGAEITMRCIDIWRVRDGLFVEHSDAPNTRDIFQQMGAVEMREGRA